MARLISIGIVLGISALLLGKLVIAADQEWRSSGAQSPVVHSLRQH